MLTIIETDRDESYLDYLADLADCGGEAGELARSELLLAEKSQDLPYRFASYYIDAGD